MADPESCPTRLENSYLKKVQYLFVVYNIKKTEKILLQEIKWTQVKKCLFLH